MTESVPNFEDLGSAETDFFTRHFPSQGYVKLQTTKDLSNAIKIKSILERKLEKDHQSVWFKNKPTLRGHLHGYNVTVEGDIASSNQIGDRSVSLEVSPESNPNLAFELGTEIKFEDDDEVETTYLQASYANDLFNSSIKVESEKDISVTGTGVIHYPNNVYWGLFGKLEQGEEKTDLLWNAKIQFKLPNHSTTVHFDNKTSKLRLNWIQKISEDISFGTYLNLNKLSVSPEFGVGMEKKIEENSCKAKIDIFDKSTNNKEFRLGLSFTRNLTQFHNTQITIGADINARSFLGTAGGDQHSFGFEIKLR